MAFAGSMTHQGFDRYSSEYITEYTEKFAETGQLRPTYTGRHVPPTVSPQKKLWSVVGDDKYGTEVSEKFSGHMPPPPAPRAIVKYEPDTLTFHAESTYRQSFKGTHAPMPEIYKPRAQGAHLNIPVLTTSEHRAQFSSTEPSPTKIILKGTFKPAAKPFVGISQYGESFTGTMPAAGHAADAASTASPGTLGSPGGDPFTTFRRPSIIGPGTLTGKLGASLEGTSPLRRSGPIGSPGKLRGITTNNDIDGSHMDPTHLMRTLPMSQALVHPPYVATMRRPASP